MSKPFMSMLFLERDETISTQALVAELRRQRPDFTGAVEILGRHEESAAACLVQLGDFVLSVMIIGARYPMEPDCPTVKNNLYWPEADKALLKSNAHVAISLMGEVENHAARVEAAKSVTWLCAAVASLASCLGIYWTNAEQVREASKLLKDCAALINGTLPIDLWVRVHLFTSASIDGQQTIGCVTTGLADFVGREIEIDPRLVHPAVLAEQVINIALYLLANGPVLKNGDDIGYSDSEFIHVDHVEASRYVAGPVLKLTYRAHDKTS